MKTLNIQSRLTFIGFLLNVVIFGFISYFLWKFLGRFNNFHISFFSIIPIIPIVCAFISYNDESLYLSEITFTDDEIRLRFKKSQKTVEIKRILKDDIKSFKLYVDANIVYTLRYCYPRLSLKVKIDLKNSELIILDDKLFIDVYGRNPRMLFAKELMINKDEIPNFKFEGSGNNIDVIENLKSYYINGKSLPYFKQVKNRFNQFPLFIKICFWLGILVIIGLFILNFIITFLQ